MGGSRPLFREGHGLETLERPEDAPPHHDPFDRIMLAQVKVDGLKFMTRDSLILYYHEGVFWLCKAISGSDKTVTIHVTTGKDL